MATIYHSLIDNYTGCIQSLKVDYLCNIYLKSIKKIQSRKKVNQNKNYNFLKILLKMT